MGCCWKKLISSWLLSCIFTKEPRNLTQVNLYFIIIICHCYNSWHSLCMLYFCCLFHFGHFNYRLCMSVRVAGGWVPDMWFHNLWCDVGHMRMSWRWSTVQLFLGHSETTPYFTIISCTLSFLLSVPRVPLWGPLRTMYIIVNIYFWLEGKWKEWIGKQFHCLVWLERIWGRKKQMEGIVFLWAYHFSFLPNWKERWESYA